MITFLKHQQQTLSHKLLCSFIALTFITSMIVPPQARAQSLPGTILNLPISGSMVGVSGGYVPALVKGIRINPENPLSFNFIVDTGESGLEGASLNEEAEKLIKYFLASLTVPEKEMWVNLSPYEKDRIIPESLGVTELGRDLLAQDYLLKQLTASLIYPENELGNKFWQKVYEKAQNLYGSTDIPLDTFNKIWIVPDKAVVYEHDGGAYVLDSHLKVMLEEDYMAQEYVRGQLPVVSDQLPVDSDQSRDTNDHGSTMSDVVREVLIPAIEEEINTGKNFAPLRQIYNSMILAVWYKMNLQASLLGQVYVDKNKTKGIDVEDREVKQKIYDQYLEAFKVGVYDYIKEEYDPTVKQVIPRKYFSGGAVGINPEIVETVKGPRELRDRSEYSRGVQGTGNVYDFGVAVADFGPDAKTNDPTEAVVASVPSDRAMVGESIAVNIDKKDIPLVAAQLIKMAVDHPELQISFGYQTIDYGFASSLKEYLKTRNGQVVAISISNQGLNIDDQEDKRLFRELLAKIEGLLTGLVAARRDVERQAVKPQTIHITMPQEEIGVTAKRLKRVGQILKSMNKKKGTGDVTLSGSSGKKQKISLLSSNLNELTGFLANHNRQEVVLRASFSDPVINLQALAHISRILDSITRTWERYHVSSRGEIEIYHDGTYKYVFIYREGTPSRAEETEFVVWTDHDGWLTRKSELVFSHKYEGYNVSPENFEEAEAWMDQFRLQFTRLKKNFTAYWNERQRTVENEIEYRKRVEEQQDLLRGIDRIVTHLSTPDFFTFDLNKTRNASLALGPNKKRNAALTLWEWEPGDPLVYLDQSHPSPIHKYELELTPFDTFDGVTLRSGNDDYNGVYRVLDRLVRKFPYLEIIRKNGELEEDEADFETERAQEPYWAMPKEITVGARRAFVPHYYIVALARGLKFKTQVNDTPKNRKELTKVAAQMISWLKKEREAIAAETIAKPQPTPFSTPGFYTAEERAKAVSTSSDRSGIVSKAVAASALLLTLCGASCSREAEQAAGGAITREAALSYIVDDFNVPAIKDIAGRLVHGNDRAKIDALQQFRTIGNDMKIAATLTAHHLLEENDDIVIEAIKTLRVLGVGQLPDPVKFVIGSMLEKRSLEGTFNSDAVRAQAAQFLEDFKDDLVYDQNNLGLPGFEEDVAPDAGSTNVPGDRSASHDFDAIEYALYLRDNLSLEDEYENDVYNRFTNSDFLRNIKRFVPYQDQNSVFVSLAAILGALKGKAFAVSPKTIEHIAELAKADADILFLEMSAMARRMPDVLVAVLTYASSKQSSFPDDFIKEKNGQPVYSLKTFLAKVGKLTTPGAVVNSNGAFREEVYQKLLEESKNGPPSWDAQRKWGDDRSEIANVAKAARAINDLLHREKPHLITFRMAGGAPFVNDKYRIALGDLRDLMRRFGADGEGLSSEEYGEWRQDLNSWIKEYKMAIVRDGQKQGSKVAQRLYDAMRDFRRALGPPSRRPSFTDRAEVYTVMSSAMERVQALAIKEDLGLLRGQRSNFSESDAAVIAKYAVLVENTIPMLWNAAKRFEREDVKVDAEYIQNTFLDHLDKIFDLEEGISDKEVLLVGKGAIYAGQIFQALENLRRDVRAAIEPRGEDRSASFDFATLEVRPLEDTGVQIKFGTSGWRGKIGKDFSLPNIRRAAQGVADYLKNQGLIGKTILVGGDTREGNAENIKETAAIYAANGFKVLYAARAVPTPALAIFAQSNPDIVLVTNFTASHNPYTDNGFKISPAHGGAADTAMTNAVGNAANRAKEYRIVDFTEVTEKGAIAEVAENDLIEAYVYEYIIPTLRQHGGWKDIVKYLKENPDFHLVLDPMQGTAVEYMKVLYGELAREAGREFFEMIHTDQDPKFGQVGGGPRPDVSASNKDLVEKVRRQKNTLGISADGDSDRFGTVDFGGEFIGANDLLAMLTYFLETEVGYSGHAVGKTVGTSNFTNEVVAYLNTLRERDGKEPIELLETAVGFKYMVEHAVNGKQFITAGEESAHVGTGPFMKSWDDGISVGIQVLWMAAKIGTSLAAYKEEIENRIGKYLQIRAGEVAGKDDSIKEPVLALIEKTKQELQEGVAPAQTTVAKQAVELVGQELKDLITLDGVKLVFKTGDWILLRPSGTEPKIKIYVEVTDRNTRNVNDLYAVAEKLIAGDATPDRSAVMTAEEVEREKKEAKVIGDRLHTPLSGDSLYYKDFTKGGDGQPGYGVSAGAAIDGNFAVGWEGNQGYYVAQTGIRDGNGRFKSGKQVFLDTVEAMKLFFKRRNARVGKPIRMIIKTGIGGQHTPFQGIADVFQAVDGDTSVVVGEYELGKDFEASIEKAVADYKARTGETIGWDQVVVIPSSKSGSTDETMMVFVSLLDILLKHAAGANGELFARTILDYLHDINFKDGQEIAGKDLFKQFNIDDLAARAQDQDKSFTKEQVVSILKAVIGNMFFETTDNPEESRLSAFIRNSGLGEILGDDAPGFGAMFENVGGRWTGDLHMMTFLAFYDLDAEAYWEARNKGIKKVRAEEHIANQLGNTILDEEIKKIALVVPDEFFWFGKSVEQNFNESIWQKGFANLRVVKISDWPSQSKHYTDKRTTLVINLTEEPMGDEYNFFDLDPVEDKDKQGLALGLARLFTTFYGMTHTVGNRLIARALKEAGYSVKDVDINGLKNPATQILQTNLYLRQPNVEMGKKMLEKFMKELQQEMSRWIAGGKIGQSPIGQLSEYLKSDGKRRMGQTNIEELNEKLLGLTDIERLTQFISSAMRVAKEQNRTFVPFIYLAGEGFVDLRNHLTRLGVEWVLQGTGDQHISYQQVLEQPQAFLPVFFSFIPEKMDAGLPAIGFAKGYLHNVPQVLVRDTFARFSYKALLDKGGDGVFVRVMDDPATLEDLRGAFQSAVEAEDRPDRSEVMAESRLLDDFINGTVSLQAAYRELAGMVQSDTLARHLIIGRIARENSSVLEELLREIINEDIPSEDARKALKKENVNDGFIDFMLAPPHSLDGDPRPLLYGNLFVQALDRAEAIDVADQYTTLAGRRLSVWSDEKTTYFILGDDQHKLDGRHILPVIKETDDQGNVTYVYRVGMKFLQMLETEGLDTQYNIQSVGEEKARISFRAAYIVSAARSRTDVTDGEKPQDRADLSPAKYALNKFMSGQGSLRSVYLHLVEIFDSEEQAFGALVNRVDQANPDWEISKVLQAVNEGALIGSEAIEAFIQKGMHPGFARFLILRDTAPSGSDSNPFYGELRRVGRQDRAEAAGVVEVLAGFFNSQISLHEAIVNIQDLGVEYPERQIVKAIVEKHPELGIDEIISGFHGTRFGVQDAISHLTDKGISRHFASFLMGAFQMNNPYLRRVLYKDFLVSGRDRAEAPGALEGTPLGGINLDAALLDMQIKRDGQGVPLPLPQQPLNMTIEGFAPIIINVTPVTNLPLLLGLGAREDGTTDFGYEDKTSPADRKARFETPKPQEVSLLK